MGSEFVDAVARFIARHDLLPEGARVLVGVSGGPDSMVCLAVLRELGYDVHGLHVNYGLRENADADEALVRAWCAERAPSIPLRVAQLDAQARAARHDESVQEAARVLRYDVFADRAEKIDAAAVAVGHHRDDQAETLLLNLLRGSGPEGLAGMPPSRPLEATPDVPLIRPLLARSRAEIEGYADENGIPWNDDPSNRDPAYDRAALRTEVMPVLEQHVSNASGALARTAALLREYVDHTVTSSLDERLDRCYTPCENENGGALVLDPLREQPSVWRRRLILAALDRTLPAAPQTAAFAQEVEGLIDAQVGRRIDTKGGRIWRERERLRFLPDAAAPEKVSTPVPVPWGEDVSLPGGVLRAELLNERPDTLDSGTACVEYADADRLVDPLAVRTWRDGDRVRPLGLNGTKPVAALLTDEKVPPHRRAGVYVLHTDAHPAWVVGHRLDHRVRVRPDTRQVARLAWRPRENTSDDCNSA